MKFRFTKKTIIIGLVVGVCGVIGTMVASAGKQEIAIINPKSSRTPSPTPKSSRGQLTGTDCSSPSTRPLAVMLASDTEARPLAGVADADMVIEMPVTEGGVTRFMAVFNCTLPKEFGAIRSARMDFIPYVLGFNALYMHWGGEHEALAELNSGITENVDCLKYDGTACLRHPDRPRPNNGYSTPSLMIDKAGKLGYADRKPFPSYVFDEKAKSQGSIAPPVLYLGEFRVEWQYDSTTNSYLRSRGGTKELDRNSNAQVRAQNIILLKTTSQYVSILYNRVKTTGTGKATIYQNGQEIIGSWVKSGDGTKLLIKDDSGQEVHLTPGKTWFEIVTQ